MNHHKRLSKWRRPIKFWRAVFTQKRWDRFYPPRLSHFTRQQPVSLLSTSFLRRSLGKQLQVTLQVYHHNSVSVFIQFICSGDHPAVEQTYQSCTVERWSSEEFNDLTGRFCTVAESYELVVCSVGLSELRESTHWAFGDAYFAFYHVCHICCSGVLVALGISHCSLRHTLQCLSAALCCTGFECIFNLGHRIQTSTSVYFYSQMMFYSTHSCSAFPFCTCQNKSPSTYQPF